LNFSKSTLVTAVVLGVIVSGAIISGLVVLVVSGSSTMSEKAFLRINFSNYQLFKNYSKYSIYF
jgi:hypothetical protein